MAAQSLFLKALFILIVVPTSTPLNKVSVTISTNCPVQYARILAIVQFLE